MPLDKLQQLMDLLPDTGFVQTFGQTEASPRATALLPEDALQKLGSVGKPIPNVEVRVVDDADNPIPHDTVGNIVIKGPNVMKGYYKRPEISAKTIKNGWLYTGDLGHMDAEGYLYLVGRKKNLIISRGQNIYPEEIEEIMLDHPTVKELRVMGEAHDVMGEKVMACVVLEDEATTTEKELYDFTGARLASCKVPSEIRIVKNLPKTATGKVRRY